MLDGKSKLITCLHLSLTQAGEDSRHVGHIEAATRQVRRNQNLRATRAQVGERAVAALLRAGTMEGLALETTKAELRREVVRPGNIWLKYKHLHDLPANEDDALEWSLGLLVAQMVDDLEETLHLLIFLEVLRELRHVLAGRQIESADDDHHRVLRVAT